MGGGSASKRARNSPDTNTTSNKDQDKTDTLSENDDEMDDDYQPESVPNKSTSSQKSSKTPATSKKLQFDPNNIPESAQNLIGFIKKSSIAKRDLNPIVDFLQHWLELNNIQNRENK